MKKIVTLILFMLCSNLHAQEALSSFDDKNISVLNDELRTINGAVRQINSGLPLTSTTGILTTNRGGTGQDFSAVPQNSVPYFSATGAMGTVGIGTTGYVLTAGNPPTWTNKSYSSITGDYAAGTYMIAGPSPMVGVTGDSTYYKAIEFYIPRGGTLTTKFWLSKLGGVSIFGRIYRNGVAVGTERTVSSATSTEFSEDISGWSVGDLCQLYLKTDDVGNRGGVFRLFENAPIKETLGASYLNPLIYGGTGAPDGALGNQGDMYLRTDGDALTTLYIKTGASTWTAK